MEVETDPSKLQYFLHQTALSLPTTTQSTPAAEITLSDIRITEGGVIIETESLAMRSEVSTDHVIVT